MEISVVGLILGTLALLIFQAFGAEASKQNGSPRAYFVMSTVPGLIIGLLILLFSPQVIG